MKDYIESITCGTERDGCYYHALASARCDADTGEPLAGQVYEVRLTAEGRLQYLGTVPTRDVALLACRRWAGSGEMAPPAQGVPA